MEDGLGLFRARTRIWPLLAVNKNSGIGMDPDFPIEYYRLRTKTSRNDARSILLELPKLIPCTSIPSIVSSVKLDNHRMVGVQRDLFLKTIGELEKSRVRINRCDKVAGPFPTFASAVLLQTI